jgi:uncharacterized membrane protein YfcA
MSAHNELNTGAVSVAARRLTLPRRVRVWAVLFFAVVVLLGLQAAWPEHRFLPHIGKDLSDGSVLAIFLAALFCEYIDSSLGMGYGTTLTPLLLLCGFEPLQIVPAVLFSEFCTGLSAGLLHHRDGNVDLLRDKRARSTVILLSLLSAVGALSAVVIALHIPKAWLSSFIAIIILSMGFVILATIRRQLRFRPGHIIGLGAIAAFNKGMSGGGYGPLVTGGQVVSGMSAKQAVAVTSVAEALTCFVGLIGYFALQGNVDWTLALPLTLGAMMSVPMATLTIRKLPETIVRGSVGICTCVLGALMILKLLL